MDYSNLSRETLIHEIKQLNKTIEQLKFKVSRQAKNELTYLNDVPFPVFYIGNEYTILWANNNAIDTYERIFERKCYQALFDFNDICPNCPYSDVTQYSTPLSIFVSKDENIWHNMLFPMIDKKETSGILEFITPHREKQQMVEDYKSTISQLTNENQEYRKRLQEMQDRMKVFSRKLLTPIKALQGIHTILQKSYLAPTQVEYLEVMAENSRMLYELFSRTMLQLEYEEKPLQYQKVEFNLVDVFEKLIIRSKGLYTDNEIELIDQDGFAKLVFGDALSFSSAMYLLIDAARATSKINKLYLQVSEVSETLKSVNLKITITDRRDENKFRLKEAFESVSTDEMDYDIEDAFTEYNKNSAIKIAKSIISSMNGTLIMSQRDLTSVHFTIFITFEKVLPVKTDIQKPLSNGRHRILIIDEERPPISLEMFEKYDIFFSKSLEQATSLFRTFEPRVTLINIMLPEHDGFKIFDALEKFKTDNQYILSISNRLIENEREFMKDYGFEDYYAKPLDQETLNQIFVTYAP